MGVDRVAWPVLRDTLNGDEQAHDRGDDSGPVLHSRNQAQPDRPVTGFVSPLAAVGRQRRCRSQA